MTVLVTVLLVLAVVVLTALVAMAGMAGIGGMALAAKAVVDALTWWDAKRHREMRALAERLGLRMIHLSLLQGERDGLPATVSWHSNDDDHWTKITVDSGVRGLTVTSAAGLHLTSRTSTGDPSFDGEFRAHGDAALVLASLDQAAREAMAAHARQRGWFGGHDLTVNDGVVTVVIEHHRVFEPLEDALRRAHAVATTLADGRDVEERLVDSARNDPVPEVRVRSLHALVQRSDSPHAREAAEHALDSDLPWARLYAAWFVRDAAALTALVDPSHPADLRRAAVDALERIPEEARAQALSTALGDADPEVVQAALAVAGGAAALREDIVGVLDAHLADWGRPGEWEGDRPIAAALIPALRALEDEQALVRMLDVPSIELRVEVMRALGQFASVGVVEAILPYRDRPQRKVRSAADAAIAAIQSRVEGAEAGALSVVDAPAAGGLSLAREPVASDEAPRPPPVRERE